MKICENENNNKTVVDETTKYIYIVQWISGYGAWGNAEYGRVLSVFMSREDAEQFVEDNYYKEYHNDWPEVCIHKEKITG